MLTTKENLLILNQNLNINYPVYFSQNIFDPNNKIGSILSNDCKNKKILIVIDKNVNRIYGKKITNFFNKIPTDYLIYEFDALESSKNFRTVEILCGLAKQFGLRRDSIFIAIGGGITMDITGFAAFIYRKKIPYIRIPTTLVGFVDAGVGLKVGINFNGSKNFLGGFYSPYTVFIDKLFLETLPLKEIRCGLFEILKMSIIKDKLLFKLIEKNYKDFFKKQFNKVTNKINYTSALYMMKELEKNLFEVDLKRLVDFGHTFSPFIEVFSKYTIPHGEAVGIDILISSFIAFNRNILTKEDLYSIVALIKSIGFTEKYTLPNKKALYESLNEIRKHRAKNLNLVLPSEIGRAFFTNKCSYTEIREAYKFLMNIRLFK